MLMMEFSTAELKTRQTDCVSSWLPDFKSVDWRCIRRKPGSYTVKIADEKRPPNMSVSTFLAIHSGRDVLSMGMGVFAQGLPPQ